MVKCGQESKRPGDRITVKSDGGNPLGSTVDVTSGVLLQISLFRFYECKDVLRPVSAGISWLYY
jgi:hypothetical protein